MLREGNVQMRRYSFTPRQTCWIILVLLFTLLAVVVDVCRLSLPRQDVLFYNATESLPRGFYLRIPAAQIQRGDLVVYDPPPEVLSLALERGYAQSHEVRFLKRVGAVAGDVYAIRAHGAFWINEVYIGETRQTDSRGRFLPQLPSGEYTVTDGAFLPVGETTRSFDGRYTGIVPLTAVRAVVIPLWTWW